MRESGIRLRTVALGLLAAVAVTAFAVVLFAGHDDSGNGKTRVQQWQPIATTASSSDVLQAVQSSQLYQEVRDSAQSLLGQTLEHATLATPVLVRAYHAVPGQYDMYVVPVLQPGSDGKPQVVALLDVAYDAKASRVSAQSIAGPFQRGDPEYGKPFPQISQDEASTIFTSAHQEATGSAPQLIYFSADLARITDPHNPQKWTSGGQFPDLAIWLFHGADGQDYIVGTDKRVIAASALPLATTTTK